MKIQKKLNIIGFKNKQSRLQKCLAFKKNSQKQFQTFEISINLLGLFEINIIFYSNQPGYQVTQNGDCGSNSQNDNCLVYDEYGNCTLCNDGYYPNQNGCSNQDLCWLKLDPVTNSLFCSECRQQTDKQIAKINQVCQVTNKRDNCAQYVNTTSQYGQTQAVCIRCQDGKQIF
ncbi:hypothetical protein TTHERM_00224510 (macronuclear) [Tetrahymena thermophila SB210]|uniref:Uncharacterized protein n=1 Tax=Tetrahymena thermophila (strain SB210) TaxID=312017 RepID=Q23C32_TETTS|nr:hypothetical protein TTHERM_00224510 [Tetrahymena thermophila SB210]EAR93936.1 hypothetical protein TTHERM_00224510 [Tetrahymena thermophila SB210]|eukprot:XP_001014181.1 hypothetical protein TTHERM_00224510 [Tetrahymena thermophila SB210]